MPSQLVAVDRVHAFIIDRLGINGNGDTAQVDGHFADRAFFRLQDVSDH
jgi:hypothetical protein